MVAGQFSPAPPTKSAPTETIKVFRSIGPYRKPGDSVAIL